MSSDPVPTLYEPIVFTPIGFVRSPYKERHGTPQQGSVEAEPQPTRIELDPVRCPPESLRDLEGMEYVWILAFFHRSQGYRSMVMPPRGPRVRRSVFATRAPHRPNAIGLSAVRLVRVEGSVLHVEACDLLDGTPVLDVKPYVPYADAFPNARIGWIAEVGPNEPQRGRKPSRRHLLRNAKAAAAPEAQEPQEPQEPPDSDGESDGGTADGSDTDPRP